MIDRQKGEKGRETACYCFSCCYLLDCLFLSLSTMSFEVATSFTRR